jgi:hypothetical protein
MRASSAKKEAILIKAGLALTLVAASGVAAAQSSSSQAAAVAAALNPANGTALAAGLLTTTGVSTSALIGSTVGGIAGGAGSGGFFGGFAALPTGVTRFALPGQGGTGAAAAPGGKPFNAWVVASHNKVSYDFAPLAANGKVNVGIAGFDYTFSNKVVAGLAIAGDKTDVDLTGSSFAAGSKLTGKGTTYSPYIGVPLDRNWTADASVGWGKTTVDTNIGGITGRVDDKRSTANLGLSYRQIMGSKWLLTGRGAYLTVRDKLGAYTLSNGTLVSDASVRVEQLRFGGQAAYNAGAFIPHIGLNYIYDIKAPNQPGAANDRDAFQAVLGVKFSGASGLYGGLQYTSELGRSQVKNDQILLNLGIRF